MQAVILAAGLGSRLRPLTDDRPKAAVLLGGRPIVNRALDTLFDAGIKQAVVVTGYRPERVADCLGDYADGRVAVVANPAYAETNTLVSLLYAAPLVDGDFVLLDGDLVFESAVLDALQAPGSRLAIDRARPLDDDAVKVALDGTRVIGVGKQLPSPLAGAAESIGMARIDAATAPALFATAELIAGAGGRTAYYEAAFDRLLAQGYVFEAADVTGCRWEEIDDHEDLRRAESRFTH